MQYYPLIYNVCMVILPGHPHQNAILRGLLAIEQGQDIEGVIAQRDSELDTAEKFVACAIEALSWIGEPVLAGDLVEQIRFAYLRMDTLAQEHARKQVFSQGTSEPHFQLLVQAFKEDA